MSTSAVIRKERSLEPSRSAHPVITAGRDGSEAQQLELGIAPLPFQSQQQPALESRRDFFVRLSAMIGLLLYIVSSPLNSFIVTVLRGGLLGFVGWYGWWEASFRLREWQARIRKEQLLAWFVRQRDIEEMKQIRLLLQTPEHLRTLLEGADAYQSRFHVKVAEGVREFISGPEVSPEFVDRLKRLAPADPWKDGFAVLHKKDKAIIGLGGFAGPPDADGTVEIAYGIAPGYQSRGYAGEVAEELIAYAFASGRVRKVCAHTLPRDNPSTRVLTKCGFGFVGEVEQGEDGIVWRGGKALKRCPQGISNFHSRF